MKERNNPNYVLIFKNESDFYLSELNVHLAFDILTKNNKPSLKNKLF